VERRLPDTLRSFQSAQLLAQDELLFCRGLDRGRTSKGRTRRLCEGAHRAAAPVALSPALSTVFRQDSRHSGALPAKRTSVQFVRRMVSCLLRSAVPSSTSMMSDRWSAARVHEDTKPLATLVECVRRYRETDHEDRISGRHRISRGIHGPRHRPQLLRLRLLILQA